MRRLTNIAVKHSEFFRIDMIRHRHQYFFGKASRSATPYTLSLGELHVWAFRLALFVGPITDVDFLWYAVPPTPVTDRAVIA